MTVLRKRVFRGSVALIVLLAIGYCANIFYQTRPRQIASNLLRLKSTPTSIRNSECEPWGVTDVLTTCTFDIDPLDFPALLKGWQFKQTRAGGDSYSFANGPKVGPEFPVAAAFVIKNPPSFLYGGSVLLVTNASRSRVQVDYYEE